jgi:hypothetical protein
MALPNTAILRALPGGSATNGGGFNPANTGFLANGAATSATGASPVFSSVSYSFVAGDVGHWLYIKSGTNTVPGWYQIASVAGGNATLSAAIAAGFTANSQRTTAVGIATVASPTSITFAVDYTRSTTPVVSVTNADSDGAAPSTLNSGTATFTRVMVGNLVHYNGSWYEIITFVDANHITVDRLAAISGTATLKVGAAFSHPAVAASLAIGGCTIVAPGAFTITSNTVNIDGGRVSLPTGVSATRPTRFVGSDDATDLTFCTLTYSTTSAGTVYGVVASGGFQLVGNVDVRTGAQANVGGIDGGNLNTLVCWSRVIGHVTANVMGISITGTVLGCYTEAGAAAATSSNGIGNSGGTQTASIAIGNTCKHTTAAGRAIDQVRTVIGNNAIAGNIVLRTSGPTICMNNCIHGGSLELTGNNPGAPIVMLNNVVGNNSSGDAYSIASTLVAAAVFARRNAYYALTGSAVPFTSGRIASDGDFFDLGASSPFVDAANGDFSLAGNAGAALLKQAGWQSFLKSSSSYGGFPDIGAVQAAASGLMVAPSMSGVPE